MNALVLANGELYRPGTLRKRIRSEDFGLVLAADAGARHAHLLNVNLDVIVGDMDSISNTDIQNAGNIEVISYPSEKDETDLELALLQAKDWGAGRIVVVGAMGGRLDMALANILLLTHPDLRSCRVEVWHGGQTGWLIRPPGDNIVGRVGDTLSLIPLAGDVSGVVTKGLKHALNNAALAFGPSRGISNVLEQSGAGVKLAKGILFAVHTPGKA